MTIDWPSLGLGFAIGWILYWFSTWVRGAPGRAARRAFEAGVDRAGGFSEAFKGDLADAIRLSVEHEAGLEPDQLADLRRGHDPETSVTFELGSVLGSEGVTTVEPSSTEPEAVATIDAGGRIRFLDGDDPTQHLAMAESDDPSGPWTRVPEGQDQSKRYVCAATPLPDARDDGATTEQGLSHREHLRRVSEKQRADPTLGPPYREREQGHGPPPERPFLRERPYYSFDRGSLSHPLPDLPHEVICFFAGCEYEGTERYRWGLWCKGHLGKADGVWLEIAAALEILQPDLLRQNPAHLCATFGCKGRNEGPLGSLCPECVGKAKENIAAQVERWREEDRIPPPPVGPPSRPAPATGLDWAFAELLRKWIASGFWGTRSRKGTPPGPIPPPPERPK